MNELKEAVKANDVERVKQLIRSGVNVDIELLTENPEYTYRAIHIVACNGNIEIAKLLLEAGAEVNNYYMYTYTPLHYAAKYLHENLGVARLLINNGANVNSLDHRYATPLHTAADYGNVEMVKLLIEAGCDLNLQNTWGNTALHDAVQLKDMYDKKGKTVAVGLYPEHIQIIKDLVRAGIDIKKENKYGYTALDLALDNVQIQDSYLIDLKRDILIPSEILDLLSIPSEILDLLI